MSDNVSDNTREAERSDRFVTDVKYRIGFFGLEWAKKYMKKHPIKKRYIRVEDRENEN